LPKAQKVTLILTSDQGQQGIYHLLQQPKKKVKQNKTKLIFWKVTLAKLSHRMEDNLPMSINK
jgi:hypothetical protein